MSEPPVTERTIKESSKTPENTKVKTPPPLKHSKKVKKIEKVKKVRTTYHLPEQLVEGLRNAAMHLAGPPEYLSLSLLVEQGLQEKLTQLQKKHTNGKAFPERPREHTGGRPSR